MASISKFLELPGEIRNKIYGYLLNIDHITPSDNAMPRWTPGSYSYETYSCRSSLDTDGLWGSSQEDEIVTHGFTYGFQTAILSTSRQINLEASKSFYGNNLFVHIRTNSDKFLDAMLNMMIGMQVPNVRCGRMAMLVDFVWPDEPSPLKFGWILVQKDLRQFLHFHWKMSIISNKLRECELRLTILNNFGMSDQRIQQHLLDPWRRTVNFSYVSITGVVQADFAAELAAGMMASKFSIKNLLCYTHTLEEMGCAQATQRDLESAYTHWKSAWIDLSLALKFQNLNHTPKVSITSEQMQHFVQQRYRLSMRQALAMSDAKNWRCALNWCFAYRKLTRNTLPVPLSPPLLLTTLHEYLIARCCSFLGMEKLASHAFRRAAALELRHGFPPMERWYEARTNLNLDGPSMLVRGELARYVNISWLS